MDTQERMNASLRGAAILGNLNEIENLLKKKAEIDGRDDSGRTALMYAISGESFGAVELLLRRGADRTLRDTWGTTAEDQARQKGLPIIERLLKEYARVGPGQNLNSNEIILLSPISNRTLEEVFNFAARERISMIRKGVDGPVEALVREKFSDIDDSASLRKAFDEHRRRGGTASEAEIFPRILLKDIVPMKAV